MNKQLINTNARIIDRKQATVNIDLRQQLFSLKVGETIVTRDKDAKRLAGSLKEKWESHSNTN